MGANSYLLTEDGKNAVAIDCGDGSQLAEFAAAHGLQIQYLLRHLMLIHIQYIMILIKNKHRPYSASTNVSMNIRSKILIIQKFY